MMQSRPKLLRLQHLKQHYIYLPVLNKE